MFTERRESAPQRPLFPLPAEVIWQAVDQMHESFDNKKPNYLLNLDSFWENRSSTYLLQRNLGSFRQSIQQWHPEHKNSYERGFIFILTAVEKSGRGIATSSTLFIKTMYDYFEGLINTPLLPTSEQIRDTLNISNEEFIKPEIVGSAISQNRLSIQLIKDITSNLGHNTEDLRKDFHAEAPNLRYHLKSKDFYPNFGPHPGLVNGTIDAYNILKLYDEHMRERKSFSIWEIDELEDLGKPWVDTESDQIT